MKAMKLLKYLSAVLTLAVLTGCSLFPTGPALPENASRALAYQLGEEPEALIIPVCDYDDSFAIGTPRVMRFPYRGLTQLNDECGSLLRRKRQPSRVLILTPSGTLWSAVPVETPEPELTFFRSKLDEAGKAQLLADLNAREFEITSGASPWLAPGAEKPETAIPAEPLDADADWSRGIAFLETAGTAATGDPFRPFDRSSARHGVYCSAENSHVKPDYAPNAILTLDYAKEQPVRIGPKAEFSDPAELRKALDVHLASGRYALLRVRLAAVEDVFPLEHSGIGALVRGRAGHYGSDLLIELPDRTTIWRCSRCFSPE